MLKIMFIKSSSCELLLKAAAEESGKASYNQDSM